MRKHFNQFQLLHRRSSLLSGLATYSAQPLGPLQPAQPSPGRPCRRAQEAEHRSENKTFYDTTSFKMFLSPKDVIETVTLQSGLYPILIFHSHLKMKY